jgi:hypothetical protein
MLSASSIVSARAVLSLGATALLVEGTAVGRAEGTDAEDVTASSVRRFLQFN